MPSRRSFLAGTAAGLTAASAAQVSGANDRIRVGCDRLRHTGAGTHLVPAFQAQPDCDVVAVCDGICLSAEPRSRQGPCSAGGRSLQGLPPSPGPRRSRCDHRWHARPLARPALDRGLRGRQGRLLRKTESPTRSSRRWPWLRLLTSMIAWCKSDCSNATGSTLWRRTSCSGKDSWTRSTIVGLIRRGSTARPDQPTTQPPANLDWEMFQGAAEHGGYSQLKQRDWRRFPQFGGSRDHH